MPDPDRREVRWGPGEEAVADLVEGRPDRPMLVVLHGGFWRPRYDRAHVRPLVAALARLGWTTVAPEYRRIPGQPDATCDDVAAALAALPGRCGPHDGRLVLLGHSAGGHLALWAAAVAPPAGLVATIGLAAVADLVLADDLDLGAGAVRAFLGQPAVARPDLDPARLLTPAVPVTLVHGTRDRTVPLQLARAYVDRHPAAALVDRPAGHFAWTDPRDPSWHVVPETIGTATGAEGAR